MEKAASPVLKDGEVVGWTFRDPISRRACTVYVRGGDVGIEHPDCEYRAEVFPQIDAFYCRHCKMNGRISGSWFIHLLDEWWSGQDNTDSPGDRRV